jgi:hypothetical protein
LSRYVSNGVELSDECGNWAFQHPGRTFYGYFGD